MNKLREQKKRRRNLPVNISMPKSLKLSNFFHYPQGIPDILLEVFENFEMILDTSLSDYFLGSDQSFSTLKGWILVRAQWRSVESEGLVFCW